MSHQTVYEPGDTPVTLTLTLAQVRCLAGLAHERGFTVAREGATEARDWCWALADTLRDHSHGRKAATRKAAATRARRKAAL